MAVEGRGQYPGIRPDCRKRPESISYFLKHVFSAREVSDTHREYQDVLDFENFEHWQPSLMPDGPVWGEGQQSSRTIHINYRRLIVDG